MTKNKTHNKANSDRGAHTHAANWFNWEIRDFQYQVDRYKKSGQVSDTEQQGGKNETSEAPKP